MVSLFCPTGQVRFEKYEVGALATDRTQHDREDSNCTDSSATARSLRWPPICSTLQWPNRLDLVPFGNRASTVHGVVFAFLRGVRGGEGTQRSFLVLR